MIGTSPAGPLRCGSTTCRTKPAATAASYALPPSSRTAIADCEASQCVEDTIPKVPWSVGRVVNTGDSFTAAHDPMIVRTPRHASGTPPAPVHCSATGDAAHEPPDALQPVLALQDGSGLARGLRSVRRIGRSRTGRCRQCVVRWRRPRPCEPGAPVEAVLLLEQVVQRDRTVDGGRDHHSPGPDDPHRLPQRPYPVGPFGQLIQRPEQQDHISGHVARARKTQAAGAGARPGYAGTPADRNPAGYACRHLCGIYSTA